MKPETARRKLKALAAFNRKNKLKANVHGIDAVHLQKKQMSKKSGAGDIAALVSVSGFQPMLPYSLPAPTQKVFAG